MSIRSDTLYWFRDSQLYKRQELLTRREHLGSPPVSGGVCVAHLISFLRCVVMLCLSSSCVLCSQCCPLLSIRDCPAAFSNVFEILLLNACLAAKTNLLVFDLTRPALIFTINRYFPTSIHVPLYIIKSININYSLIYYKRSVNMVQPCLYTPCGLWFLFWYLQTIHDNIV